MYNSYTEAEVLCLREEDCSPKEDCVTINGIQRCVCKYLRNLVNKNVLLFNHFVVRKGSSLCYKASVLQISLCKEELYMRRT